MSLIDLVREQIRTRGPLAAASFIDLALYHPEFGYYARAGQRSGRGGDFFTSVDVGPLFGELLAVQIAECFDFLAPGPRPPASDSHTPGTRHQAPLDLVEAGAGNGRLARDIFDALERERPDLYARTRLHLVERSRRAREAQRGTLGPHVRQIHADTLESGAVSGTELPERIVGVIYANELVDALPVHIVVMRERGLREMFVGERDGTLVEVEGAPSTPALQAYLDRADIALEPGGRAEINLAADDWIASAARAIERGFLILIDYGHVAPELFSGSHATGTLATFSGHRASARASDWLREPGERDITSHVDLTSVRLAAERAGFTTLGVTDQTYFLMGLGLPERIASDSSRTSHGFPPPPEASARLAEARFAREGGSRTNQAKTLMLPGGLGSTHKVMVFGKGVGQPALKGLSYRVRVT